jgi:hypothetical protein
MAKVAALTQTPLQATTSHKKPTIAKPKIILISVTKTTTWAVVTSTTTTTKPTTMHDLCYKYSTETFHKTKDS